MLNIFMDSLLAILLITISQYPKSFFFLVVISVSLAFPTFKKLFDILIGKKPKPPHFSTIKFSIPKKKAGAISVSKTILKVHQQSEEKVSSMQKNSGMANTTHGPKLNDSNYLSLATESSKKNQLVLPASRLITMYHLKTTNSIKLDLTTRVLDSYSTVLPNPLSSSANEQTTLSSSTSSSNPESKLFLNNPNTVLKSRRIQPYQSNIIDYLPSERLLDLSTISLQTPDPFATRFAIDPKIYLPTKPDGQWLFVQLSLLDTIIHPSKCSNVLHLYLSLRKIANSLLPELVTIVNACFYHASTQKYDFKRILSQITDAQVLSVAESFGYCSKNPIFDGKNTFNCKKNVVLDPFIPVSPFFTLTIEKTNRSTAPLQQVISENYFCFIGTQNGVGNLGCVYDVLQMKCVNKVVHPTSSIVCSPYSPLYTYFIWNQVFLCSWNLLQSKSDVFDPISISTPNILAKIDLEGVQNVFPSLDGTNFFALTSTSLYLLFYDEITRSLKKSLVAVQPYRYSWRCGKTIILNGSICLVVSLNRELVIFYSSFNDSESNLLDHSGLLKPTAEQLTLLKTQSGSSSGSKPTSFAVSKNWNYKIIPGDYPFSLHNYSILFDRSNSNRFYYSTTKQTVHYELESNDISFSVKQIKTSSFPNSLISLSILNGKYFAVKPFSIVSLNKMNPNNEFFLAPHSGTLLSLLVLNEILVCLTIEGRKLLFYHILDFENTSAPPSIHEKERNEIPLEQFSIGPFGNFLFSSKEKCIYPCKIKNGEVYLNEEKSPPFKNIFVTHSKFFSSSRKTLAIRHECGHLKVSVEFYPITNEFQHHTISFSNEDYFDTLTLSPKGYFALMFNSFLPGKLRIYDVFNQKTFSVSNFSHYNRFISLSINDTCTLLCGASSYFGYSLWSLIPSPVCSQLTLQSAKLISMMTKSASFCKSHCQRFAAASFLKFSPNGRVCAGAMRNKKYSHDYPYDCCSPSLGIVFVSPNMSVSYPTDCKVLDFFWISNNTIVIHLGVRCDIVVLDPNPRLLRSIPYISYSFSASIVFPDLKTADSSIQLFISNGTHIVGIDIGPIDSSLTTPQFCPYLNNFPPKLSNILSKIETSTLYQPQTDLQLTHFEANIAPFSSSFSSTQKKLFSLQSVQNIQKICHTQVSLENLVPKSIPQNWGPSEFSVNPSKFHLFQNSSFYRNYACFNNGTSFILWDMESGYTVIKDIGPILCVHINQDAIFILTKHHIMVYKIDASSNHHLSISLITQFPVSAPSILFKVERNPNLLFLAQYSSCSLVITNFSSTPPIKERFPQQIPYNSDDRSFYATEKVFLTCSTNNLRGFFNKSFNSNQQLEAQSPDWQLYINITINSCTAIFPHWSDTNKCIVLIGRPFSFQTTYYTPEPISGFCILDINIENPKYYENFQNKSGFANSNRILSHHLKGHHLYSFIYIESHNLAIFGSRFGLLIFFNLDSNTPFGQYQAICDSICKLHFHSNDLVVVDSANTSLFFNINALLKNLQPYTQISSELDRKKTLYFQSPSNAHFFSPTLKFTQFPVNNLYSDQLGLTIPHVSSWVCIIPEKYWAIAHTNGIISFWKRGEKSAFSLDSFYSLFQGINSHSNVPNAPSSITNNNASDSDSDDDSESPTSKPFQDPISQFYSLFQNLRSYKIKLFLYKGFVCFFSDSIIGQIQSNGKILTYSLKRNIFSNPIFCSKHLSIVFPSLSRQIEIEPDTFLKITHFGANPCLFAVCGNSLNFKQVYSVKNEFLSNTLQIEILPKTFECILSLSNKFQNLILKSQEISISNFFAPNIAISIQKISEQDEFLHLDFLFINPLHNYEISMKRISLRRFLLFPKISFNFFYTLPPAFFSIFMLDEPLKLEKSIKLEPSQIFQRIEPHTSSNVKWTQNLEFTKYLFAKNDYPLFFNPSSKFAVIFEPLLSSIKSSKFQRFFSSLFFFSNSVDPYAQYLTHFYRPGGEISLKTILPFIEKYKTDSSIQYFHTRFSNYEPKLPYKSLSLSYKSYCIQQSDFSEFEHFQLFRRNQYGSEFFYALGSDSCIFIPINSYSPLYIHQTPSFTLVSALKINQIVYATVLTLQTIRLCVFEISSSSAKSCSSSNLSTSPIQSTDSLQILSVSENSVTNIFAVSGDQHTSHLVNHLKSFGGSTSVTSAESSVESSEASEATLETPPQTETNFPLPQRYIFTQSLSDKSILVYSSTPNLKLIASYSHSSSDSTSIISKEALNICWLYQQNSDPMFGSQHFFAVQYLSHIDFFVFFPLYNHIMLLHSFINKTLVQKVFFNVVEIEKGIYRIFILLHFTLYSIQFGEHYSADSESDIDMGIGSLFGDDSPVLSPPPPSSHTGAAPVFSTSHKMQFKDKYPYNSHSEISFSIKNQIISPIIDFKILFIPSKGYISVLSTSLDGIFVYSFKESSPNYTISYKFLTLLASSPLQGALIFSVDIFEFGGFIKCVTSNCSLHLIQFSINYSSGTPPSDVLSSSDSDSDDEIFASLFYSVSESDNDIDDGSFIKVPCFLKSSSRIYPFGNRNGFVTFYGDNLALVEDLELSVDKTPLSEGEPKPLSLQLINTTFFRSINTSALKIHSATESILFCSDKTDHFVLYRSSSNSWCKRNVVFPGIFHSSALFDQSEPQKYCLLIFCINSAKSLGSLYQLNVDVSVDVILQVAIAFQFKISNEIPYFLPGNTNSRNQIFASESSYFILTEDTVTQHQSTPPDSLYKDHCLFQDISEWRISHIRSPDTFHIVKGVVKVIPLSCDDCLAFVGLTETSHLYVFTFSSKIQVVSSMQLGYYPQTVEIAGRHCTKNGTLVWINYLDSLYQYHILPGNIRKPFQSKGNVVCF